MVNVQLAKILMKLRENKIQFDITSGSIFQELFNHPDYLTLDKVKQVELGLEWAEDLYQIETERSSIDVHLRNFDTLIERSRGGTILDIGCYLGGRTIKWLERYQASAIHGIDVDSRFIEVANCFAEKKGRNAHFKVNFAEELDFPDQYFDMILSENTFEHVTDLKRVMIECMRVLKKDGLLVVLFPSFWGATHHHLDLVTRMPCLHWFFEYPTLLDAYRSILDERGIEALWYKPDLRCPLPLEKGLTINGTSANVFRKLARQNWSIVVDGYKEQNRPSTFIKRYLSKCLKSSRIPIFRELFPIAYVLRKH